jgi:hypothetical protein
MLRQKFDIVNLEVIREKLWKIGLRKQWILRVAVFMHFRRIEIGPKRPGIARKPLELAARRPILRAARERRKQSAGRTAQKISSFDAHIHFNPISHRIDLYGREIVIMSLLF